MVQDYNLVLWKMCTWPVILTVFGAESAKTRKTIGSECNKTNERTVLEM